MSSSDPAPSRPAVVVIGRNEGARLLRCLASLQQEAGPVVYVDSGSTDGSVAAARNAGAQVVELDMSRPFTAARARNAGLAALGPDLPGVVQFVDGDCEMQPGWLDRAAAFLQAHPGVAVVSGRLRERHPEASPYNALCDAEWDRPEGQAQDCGGIAMMRGRALLALSGPFNAQMIAGEEPELCLRLRRAGWQIWRLADEMALHDAAMTRFGQFWRRMRRGGFAFALWAGMHGAGPERMGVAPLRRALVWGAALPLAILLACLALGPWALLGLLLYPLQVARLARSMGWGNGLLLTLGKFAEAQGALEYAWRRITGQEARIIEHK